MLLTLALCTALAQEIPNRAWSEDVRGQIVSPSLGELHQNQPFVVNGVLLAGGNGIHPVWDISDPTAPVQLATLESPHHMGEAEAHQHAALRRPDGTTLLATISGKGVDVWDLTDPADPALLAAVELEGVNYGDNTNAVWGVAWQGDVLYVGGTNTGLHVLDISEPTAPALVRRLTTTELGGVSAGPLWALGTLLVITSPKDHGGIATLDISDPLDPALLDAELPADGYIGAFYGGHAFLTDPWRAWDVSTDPTDIVQVGEWALPDHEYASFGDGIAFIGAMRPAPGILLYDVTDPADPVSIGKIDGRYEKYDGVFTDDQFGLPIANLLAICDDEIQYGCVLAVRDPQPDAIPPEVMRIWPADGAVEVAPTASIGVSLSDQIDLRSVSADTFAVQALAGGEVSGSWGFDQTVLTFTPDVPLLPDATYEVALEGITDLGGNPMGRFTSVFATGADVAALTCAIEPPVPVEVGETATLTAVDAGAVSYAWSTGGTGVQEQASWQEAGRHRVTLTVSDALGSRTCAAVQVVHEPLLPAAPVSASTVAVAGEAAWVVNPDADTVSRVDLATLAVAEEIAICDLPRTLSLDGDRVWVACSGADEVAVLDASGAIERVGLGWGAAPYGIAVAEGTAWVALEGREELVAIDTATLAITERIGLGAPVRGVAVAEGRVLLSRYLSGPEQGELFAVEAGEVDTLALAADPGPDSNDAGRGVPNALSHVALSPSGRHAVLAGKKDNTGRGLFRDGQPLDPDNTVRTVVAWLDLATGEEVQRLDLDDHELAFATAFSPLGDLLFIASQGSNRVDVVDVADGRRLAGFPTGLAPNGLALTEDGRLLVQAMNSRTLTVHDVSGLLAGTDASVSQLAAVRTVAEEPLSEQVLLGKQIFHNGSDPRMSQDGYISCATCHLDGGHDGRVWDFTDRGEGLRNTIDLRGKAGTGHGPVHWTANFDEIHDFENDIRLAFGGGGLMADADFEATADPLGEPKAGRSAALDALAAYVATFDAFPRSPHRELDGTLTEAALEGKRIFARRDCLSCHSGPTLTDSAEGVRHDVGTLTEASGQRLGEALDGLDTPTLLGLHATAPYFHDGSAATLYEVLERHGNAGALPEDKADALVAYLLQLEEDEVPIDKRCGCATGSGAAWLWVGALAFARRRRSPG